MRTRKPRKPKTIVGWAEVDLLGNYTVYDLAPTREGVESGKANEDRRAIKVKITPIN